MTTSEHRTKPAAATGALLAAAAGAFGSLDSALNIAFPDLVASFYLSVGQLQWVVICFVAASGGLLVPAGVLGDRIGHATMVMVGASLSVLALAACALAPSFGLFLGARVLQGVGTAAIMSSAPALATLASGPSRRARAIGTFQSAAAIGLASGPVIGGLMVALVGWRGVFWFRVPLAAVLLILAMRAAGAAGRPPSTPEVAVGSTAGDQRSASLLGSSRLAVMMRRDVVVANLLTFVANGAMFATWLLVPALLVDEIGVSVIVGGLVLAVSPAATALVAAATSRIVERFGSTPTAVAGLVTLAVGLAIVALADRAWSLLGVAVALALVGSGLGLFSVPNMAAVMGAVGSTNQGLGGAVNLMMRTLGIVIGAAWHSRIFDRVASNGGFGPAFTRVFLLSAAIVVAAAALAALSNAGPANAGPAKAGPAKAGPATRRQAPNSG